MIKLLNTTVHVESRSRFDNALNTSATPASPECVAIKMCSMYLCGSMINIYFSRLSEGGGEAYFDFGGAACGKTI